jgi:uncharacterized membrane protein YkvA (DUF1232 family)
MSRLILNSFTKRIRFIFSLHKSLPLVWKLLKDKRVALGSKGLFVLGLVYLISPLDFIPDIFLLPIGLTDDFALMIFLFERFLNSIPKNLLEEYLS